MTNDQRAAEIPAWGGSRDLSPADSMMWRTSYDPRLRLNMMAMEMLDTVPDWDRLLAAHEWGTRLIPRTRERVVGAPLNIGPPVWSVAPDFAVTDHLRAVTLPRPGSFRQLLDLAAEICRTPFDPQRPPWEGVLVDGLADGGAAYLLKLHHATSDGMGFIQLLSRAHSDTREPNPDKATPPPPPPGTTTGTDLLVKRLAATPWDAAHALSAVGSWLTGVVRHPESTARGLATYLASLRRLLSSEGGPSPLLAGRSEVRRFEAFSMPFDDLKSAAKAGGGSINDAFLAAVAGGIARYHRRFGLEPGIVPIGMPVNVRVETDAPGGNRFAGIRVPVRADEPDPRERIRQVGAYVAAARREPAVNALGAATVMLAPLPGPLIGRLTLGIGRQLDVQASNVPGLRRPTYFAGARVTKIYGFAPCPGVAAMISLLSHDDVFCVGVNLDVASFLEPEEFAECLQEGFAEVLALNGE